MPKLWKCTVCAQISFWDEASFNCYGSVLLDDEAPQWRIITCSALCLHKAKANLACGKWTAARVKPRGYTAVATAGKGYEPQPSQEKLLEEWNEAHPRKAAP